jgi:hypothetical protein
MKIRGNSTLTSLNVKVIINKNLINSVSLQGAERLRGKAEANPEIPRFARNRLCNLKEEIASLSLAMTMKKTFSAFTMVRGRKNLNKSE